MKGEDYILFLGKCPVNDKVNNIEKNFNVNLHLIHSFSTLLTRLATFWSH